MYYFEEKQIPELYQIRHRHDSDNNFADYGEKILDKTVSPFFYGNLASRAKPYIGTIKE